MTALIESLIEGQDNFEIIRDQIAGILLVESAQQQVFATAAGEDPQQWKLRVFTERSNPFEEWITAPDPELQDASPIVNVWIDRCVYDQHASNVVERQKTTGTYHVDIYGYGVSRDTDEGHEPGDQQAALEAHRAYRLVRRIIMAGAYTYLGLRGTVWQRWPRDVTFFQPQLPDRPVQRISGARLALEVSYNEQSPQVEGEGIEALYLDLKRAETGEVYLSAGFEYEIDS